MYKLLKTILILSLCILGCENQHNQKVDTKIQTKEFDLNEELLKYIDKIYKDYDLKTPEGIKGSLDYFDGVEKIFNKKKQLSKEEKYFVNELQKNKTVMQLYIYNTDEDKVRKDFENLNFKYIKNVLLPFHSIKNNYNLILKNDRDSNEFYDKTLLLYQDLIIVEMSRLTDEELRSVNKPYLIDEDPGNLINRYLVDNNKYAKSKNQFEVVMYSSIEKLMLEISNSYNLNSPFYLELKELMDFFPAKYFEKRENKR